MILFDMFWRQSEQGRDKRTGYREKESEEPRMTSKFWDSNGKNKGMVRMTLTQSHLPRKKDKARAGKQ